MLSNESEEVAVRVCALSVSLRIPAMSNCGKPAKKINANIKGTNRCFTVLGSLSDIPGSIYFLKWRQAAYRPHTVEHPL